jgi:hypothetical protein
VIPYYQDDLVTIYHCDCRDYNEFVEAGCLVWDPQWDDDFPYDPAEVHRVNTLSFTDPRNLHKAIRLFGDSPAWIFTWDCMNQWQTGPRRPVQRAKHCLWYGDIDSYSRDAELWGDAPPERDHPTTKQTPLDGRRLADIYSESLRWLHNPGASGSAGTERFSERQGNPVYRHAKPLNWMRCLIGNTSSGLVFDPFMGSGTSLRAAKDLSRKAIGIEIDEECCEIAANRMSQEVLAF